MVDATWMVKYIVIPIVDELMPPKENRWTVYGVTEENKIIIKVVATKNTSTVGEALNKIIEEWIEFKKNNNEEI